MRNPRREEAHGDRSPPGVGEPAGRGAREARARRRVILPLVQFTTTERSRSYEFGLPALTRRMETETHPRLDSSEEQLIHVLGLSVALFDDGVARVASLVPLRIRPHPAARLRSGGYVRGNPRAREMGLPRHDSSQARDMDPPLSSHRGRTSLPCSAAPGFPYLFIVRLAGSPPGFESRRLFPWLLAPGR